jgi:hypothetical protein
LNQVLGAAVFDLSGLPVNYYISIENNDISWVQTIFQTLGLQTLLSSLLQLETFRHAVIQSTQFHVVAVRQPCCYVALLIHQSDVVVTEEFLQWAVRFDPKVLIADSRSSFQLV